MFSGVVGEPSKTEEERVKNIARTTKLSHVDKNPCIKEQDMAYKCLDENNYDRNVCAGYFENYKKCKDFWGTVRVDRRRAGIVPNLPPAAERDQIKRDFLEKLKAEREKRQ